MKILLVGEYSRLHNSLKEGLLAQGHEVTLIATGDGFKKFPADILLKRTLQSGWQKKFRVAFHRFFGLDLSSAALLKQFKDQAAQLQGYDVVQLINESSLELQPKHERELISWLKTHNDKLFVLSCGTDHSSVAFANSGQLRYSILTPHAAGKISDKQAYSMLKYLRPEYEALHHYVMDQVDGVIASDLDYHLPLLNNPKYKGLIPNPINLDKLPVIPLASDGKIVIFHGINRQNYYKKGNDFFEKALEELQKSHGNQFELITAESLPYSEYIKAYDRAHIILDQVYSYDQGYNALEAMAKGKVVFTGASEEFLEYYQLEDRGIVINALPQVAYLKEQLVRLLENPQEIQRIAAAARQFVKDQHDYKKIADRYVSVWTS
ncbi:glycosyltransferase family protein [Gilvibacter sediminis]|uniref:glycosyltransferase family protein n=1 Tax=Gilvibacter sediminis TaxID=379071 RepID=UPI002350596F|nr:glycosyltransferase [Gilvibacter sediminis]MDC7998474.1 glycosyltransferase [Gilvibacter sediminis]